MIKRTIDNSYTKFDEHILHIATQVFYYVQFLRPCEVAGFARCVVLLVCVMTSGACFSVFQLPRT